MLQLSAAAKIRGAILPKRVHLAQSVEKPVDIAAEGDKLRARDRLPRKNATTFWWHLELAPRVISLATKP